MTARSDHREDLEETVDRLEEKVLGHRVDQTRDEQDDQAAATEGEPGARPGVEPTD